MSRTIARNGEIRLLQTRETGGEIRRAKAERLEALVDTAVGVVRRPPRNILEEPDRPDAALRAQVEPVMRTARYADQIAGFHFDREDRSFERMHVEESTTFDDEPH